MSLMMDRSVGGVSWFRITLMVVTLFTWLLFIFMLGHESDQPAVFGKYSRAYAGFLAALLLFALTSLAMHTRVVYPTLYAHRAAIALSFGSLIIALAAGEATARTFDPLGISYYAEAYRSNLEREADATLIYRYKPDLRAIYQGVRVEINSFGFRDTEVAERRPDEFRILALGDSVTFGWGVEHEQVYTERLQHSLTKATRQPVNVINTGVGGYNTEQQLATLQLYGDTLQPDAVTLLYVSNDVEINEPPYDPRSGAVPWGKGPVQIVKALFSRSWFYRLVRHYLIYVVSADVTYPDIASEGSLRSMDAVVGISDFCEQQGIPLVVFLYRIERDQFTDSLRDSLHYLADNTGFTFVDTLDWFAGSATRDITNSIVDSHPNPEGHRILAEGAAPYVLNMKGLR